MNWEAIGAVGEIIGAGVVVITLIYLSIQLRQNTAATQSSRLENQFRSINAWYGQMNDPDSARTWLAGLQDYRALSNVDRVRFHSMAIQIVLSYEQARTFVQQGLYSESGLAPQEAWTVALINTPGGQTWWTETESDWNPELRAHLATLSRSYSHFVPDPMLDLSDATGS